MDEVLEYCEAYCSVHKAPHVPIATTPTVSMSNEKLQVDLLCSDDTIVLRATDACSKFPLSMPVRSGNPHGVWDAFWSAWGGVFGQPTGFRADEGGGWMNEIWPGLCSERRIQLQSQAAGARPRTTERRNGLARGICCRLVADHLFPGEQILSEVQCCPNAPISAGGLSAYQTVRGSDLVDPLGAGSRDTDLLFARDASPSGQFSQQWKVHAMARGAAPKEVANRELRRPSAYTKPCKCTGVKIGDSVLRY